METFHDLCSCPHLPAAVLPASLELAPPQIKRSLTPQCDLAPDTALGCALVRPFLAWDDNDNDSIDTISSFTFNDSNKNYDDNDNNLE
eukprot:613119-Pelagomonas_calceolata.AAC.1